MSAGEDSHIINSLRGEFKKNKTAAIISLISFLLGQLFLFLLGVHWLLQVAFALLYIGIFTAGARYQGFVVVFRIATPITIGMFFTQLYEFLYIFEAFLQFFTASMQLRFHIERFFEVMSTLYAITSAFLLWKGLSDHDHLKVALHDEANSISAILNLVDHFDAEDKNRDSVQGIRNDIVLYIDNIIHGHAIKKSSENDGILSKICLTSSLLNLTTKNCGYVMQELLREVNALRMIRSRRISYLENKMSPYILFALFLMSLSILFPFFTIAPEQAGEAMYVIMFTLATLLAFMFITMVDIAQPFTGFWKIKTAAFSDVRSKTVAAMKSNPVDGTQLVG